MRKGDREKGTDLFFAGQVKIIACIEDTAVIERILAHLKGKELAELAMLPEGRAPPQARLFD